jgi:hypothetical protein
MLPLYKLRVPENENDGEQYEYVLLFRADFLLHFSRTANSLLSKRHHSHPLIDDDRPNG